MKALVKTFDDVHDFYLTERRSWLYVVRNRVKFISICRDLMYEMMMAILTKKLSFVLPHKCGELGIVIKTRPTVTDVLLSKNKDGYLNLHSGLKKFGFRWWKLRNASDTFKFYRFYVAKTSVQNYPEPIGKMGLRKQILQASEKHADYKPSFRFKTKSAYGILS